MNLKDYLDRESVTHTAFAERISVTQQAVSRYCLGQRIPGLKVMTRIVEATDRTVMANDFFGLKDGGTTL